MEVKSRICKVATSPNSEACMAMRKQSYLSDLLLRNINPNG
jgi:hypothetical protein